MKNIPLSSTIAMNTLAQEKRARGEIVYNFAAGDPVLANHPFILEGAKQALEKKSFPYPPAAGIPELRKSVSDWMNKNYGTRYAPMNSVVTPGGKFAIFAALQTLLSPGDEVLIISPYWPSYPLLTEMCRAVPKIIRTTQKTGWKITPKDLEGALTSKSKILILNPASNPTGAFYTKTELAALLKIAQERELIVISDEVYSGLVFTNDPFISCGSFPEYEERVIVIQSCSKNFGMTGWRIGFALSSEEMTKKLVDYMGQTMSGTAILSQWAAVSALNHADEVTSYVKMEMEKRRELFFKTIRALFSPQIEATPSSLYAFIALKELGVTVEAPQFCQEALIKANIALVPGEAFGEPGYVRFAFTSQEDEILKGLTSLRMWL